MNANSHSAASLLATLAVGAAFVGAVTVSAVLPSTLAVAADKKEENKVSKDLAKPLKAAQDALNAKKYPDALAKLHIVEGWTHQRIANEKGVSVNTVKTQFRRAKARIEEEVKRYVLN